MKFIRFQICTLVLATSASIGASAQMTTSHAARKPAPKPVTASVPSVGKPVAKVNGTVLTDRDLLRQMLTDFPYARQHGGKFPKGMEGDMRDKALTEIVFDELVYQEALRRKLTIPPAKLDSEVAAFRKQFASKEDFQKYLQAEQGGSMANLREKSKRALLIEKVLQTDVKQKSKVMESEVRAYYDKNPDHFRKGETISIQTISLVIPDDATEKQKTEIRKRAEELLKQAKATKDYEGFGVLAEKSSEDDWRVMMGDHHTIFRGTMPASVEKVAFALKPGQTSDLIQTENSWCIVRLNAHEDARLMPYAEVHAQIKQDMEAQRSMEARRQLAARLQKNAKIELL